ncbi:hypothetical protein GY45DRAFT_1115342 [Cubamyces sp. BRFM 1775]|nr:hypothetical protein GY45DRAFT_1115342 [Cubamyces sp. BRFM 1775]
MQHYAFVVLAIALLGHATASPVAPSVTKTTVIGASFPVANPALGGPRSNATLPQGGPHSYSTRQEFPATLLLCEETGCASCLGFDLSTTPAGECLDPSISFTSAAISQNSGEGLPFDVLLGNADCAGFVRIPQVNDCIELGGTFATFAIRD